MDQLRISSDFLKGLIAKFIVKKANKYVTGLKIDSLQVDKCENGDYKIHYNVHANGDIFVTEEQVSQFLHNL